MQTGKGEFPSPPECITTSQQAYKMAAVVWDFFKVSEEDNSLAVCNKCSRKIPRGGRSGISFNTSNLRSHLQHNHRFDGVFKAYEDACSAKGGNKPAAKKSPGLTPIGEAFEKSKKFTRDDTRAKAIGNLIMDMMALDDQPFTLVEDRGFTRLVNHLEPRFTMPSRRYFADVCLPAKYEAIAKCIHTLIDDNNNNDISFTMDIWTCDFSPVSMMSLTAQWLNADFKLHRAVLHSQELPGSHTAAAIHQALEVHYLFFGTCGMHIFTLFTLKPGAKYFSSRGLYFLMVI